MKYVRLFHVFYRFTYTEHSSMFKHEIQYRFSNDDFINDRHTHSFPLVDTWYSSVERSAWRFWHSLSMSESRTCHSFSFSTISSFVLFHQYLLAIEMNRILFVYHDKRLLFAYEICMCRTLLTMHTSQWIVASYWQNLLSYSEWQESTEEQSSPHILLIE
jgi:hypothetical protein